MSSGCTLGTFAECCILKWVLQRQALRFTPSWAEKLSNVQKLNGHEGCVNRLAWSEDGSLLASGSDDRQVAVHLYLTERAYRHSDDLALLWYLTTVPILDRCYSGHIQTQTKALWHYRQSMQQISLVSNSCPAPVTARSSLVQWTTQSCCTT